MATDKFKKDLEGLEDYLKDNFAVEVVHTKFGAELRVTHNGFQFTTILFHGNVELAQVSDAIQVYLDKESQ